MSLFEGPFRVRLRPADRFGWHYEMEYQSSFDWYGLRPNVDDFSNGWRPTRRWALAVARRRIRRHAAYWRRARQRDKAVEYVEVAP